MPANNPPQELPPFHHLFRRTPSDVPVAPVARTSSTELVIPSSSGAPPDHQMGRTDTHPHKSRLEIILDSPFLTLKGTGPDVEPTSLSGHVALFLTESTSIKEITLQFRGKAKIPMPANES
jgi:hypothetical protein